MQRQTSEIRYSIGLQQLELVNAFEFTAPASWGNYGDWSECSVSCGTGIRTRPRECLYPACYNGVDCEGDPFETETCEGDGKLLFLADVKSQILKQECNAIVVMVVSV